LLPYFRQLGFANIYAQCHFRNIGNFIKWLPESISFGSAYLARTVPFIGLVILLFSIWSLILAIWTSIDLASFTIGASWVPHFSVL
jgi:hypothetical protein